MGARAERMAFRDLFKDFAQLRDKLNAGNPHRTRSPGIEADGIHLSKMGSDVEQSLYSDEEKPTWTHISDNVRSRFDQLEIELRQLQQVHQTQLRQGVDQAKEQEKEDKANALTESISAGFMHCHKWIDMVVKKGAGSTDDTRVRKNVQVALATRLQKLSNQFRKDQRRFMKQLHDQSKTANQQDDPFSFVSAIEEDEEEAFFSQAQLEEIDHMQDLVDERDKEVQHIAKSIAQLSEIFKELSTLVIDSGTILDRIDFNMEVVTENVHKAEEDLESASKYNGRGISAWCIIALLILCVIMALVVGIKKGTKDQ